MKIVDVRTVLLTGPCTNDPFLSEARQRRSAAFIEVIVDSGIVGIGETYAGYFLPEAIPSIVEFFKPILVGQPLQAVDQLWQRMYHCGNFWCRVGLGLNVLNGIEAALWDALGKAQGLPVHALLGGAKHDSLPCYATGGPSNGPHDRLHAKIDFYLSLGFKGIKIGAGWILPDGSYQIPNTPAAAAELEAEKLYRIRQRYGNELAIMIDGHMGNSPTATWDLATADAVMAAVQPYNLLFFEEPLHYCNLEGYRELCDRSAVPIAAGECLTGVSEWQSFVDKCDVGQPDASFTGGLGEFLRVAKLLEAADKQIATHAWGAGASLMQNIHCGFAAANCLILEVPPAFGPLHQELIGDSFQMVDGRVLTPQSPGHGIQLTDSMKQKYSFVPGSGEFNSVPGKVMLEEQGSFYATQ
ncbi:mandelate racemase/muconate lactonizing enzyme family protein [Lacipirellula parvula]|uniref:Mandelate racemase/muconate lactonizing enzyme family protein n=1 Tax=Lacipirellula parvula TaxID=2650471 RepID=A0A5K7XB86_9BACT|nr:mandelate racemase/muconate lactonizing enzyme family protein [Lacipirellula parvula]BBO33625.1 mandelate racemase/muconate lactonizing enzyme family protein [Lacipirellula parvula]